MFGHAFSLSNANNDSVISSAEFDGEANRTFAGYDQNKDGRLSRDEYSGPGSVRSPMGGFVKEQPDNLIPLTQRWRSTFARPDHQHHSRRQNCDAGKAREYQVQRDVLVPEYPERPVPESPACDTHQVHDSVARGPRVLSNNLAQDRHVIAVKHAPAEPECRESEDGHSECFCIAHTEEGGQEKQRSQSACKDAAAHR